MKYFRCLAHAAAGQPLCLQAATRRRIGFAATLAVCGALAASCTYALPHSAKHPQRTPAAPGSKLIQPDELVRLLKSKKKLKPLVLQVGFHVLYVSAHVPTSEYAGPASKPAGIRQLRARVKSLPRSRFIVLYCGCCPWVKCPNVRPAYQELKRMGFTNVKLLYLPHNFRTDWVKKGYPVQKGG